MNVYDFDKTIYYGDSTLDFYLFCLKRHKSIALCFPSLVCAYVKYYVFHIGDKTQFKETMYRFLRKCDENDIIDFWSSHESKLKSWYLKQKNDDDLIISASPEFLLSPICSKLNISLIASKVDFKSGKYSNKNCYNEQKVIRYREIYGDTAINEFYSDSYSDEPLAKISQKAYIVDKDKITPWDFTKHKKPRI